MRWIEQVVVPGALLAVGGGAAWLAQGLARRRRQPTGDTGDFWARIVLFAGLALGLLYFFSGWIEAVSRSSWRRGLHLAFDLTSGWGLPGGAASALAMALPFLLWGLLLAVGLLRKPGGRGEGRWLAGAVGPGHSRSWVLFVALPLVLALALALPRLGGGPGAFPGGAWSTLAVFVLSLVGVAASRGKTAATGESGRSRRPAPGPAAGTEDRGEDWPSALRERGIEVRTLASFQASPPPRPPRGRAAAELARRLRRRGAIGIAPEVIEAVAELLAPNPTLDEHAEHGRATAVHAPDDCGQAEVVATAATVLAERYREHTLVIVRDGAEELGLALGRFLPEGIELAVVRKGQDLTRNAQIWVTEAEHLAGSVLHQLTRGDQEKLLAGLGLIVWWEMDRFSGVLAPQAWALSCRLARRIRHQGRPDLRTLALVRRPSQSAAGVETFVRQILPHPELVNAYVEPRFARDLSLHLLGSQSRFLGREGGLPEACRHPLLGAAKVSLEAGWTTHLALPPTAAEAMTRPREQISAGGQPIADQLAASPAEARARLLEIAPADALALVELLAQGGRAGEGGVHHVGITVGENPYVRYLLRTLPQHRGKASPARRLLAPAGHETLVRRQLLLALGELPDTGRNLGRDFLRIEQTLGETLDALARDHQLLRQEVRTVDEQHRLVPDHHHVSLRDAIGPHRPLGTLGENLVAIKDPTDAFSADGIKLLVDLERLTLDAYPHRIFVHRGQRYRVEEWRTAADLRGERGERGQPWLACHLEPEAAETWRIRRTRLFDLKPSPGSEPARLGPGGGRLRRQRVDLFYQEEIQGVWRRGLDAGGAPAAARRQGLGGRLPTVRWPTEALLLTLAEPRERTALASLAAALLPLLPVHLGLAEDALEVVPVAGERRGDEEVWGLAFVDLHPGGIGLAAALAGDESLFGDLFAGAFGWLDACPCKSRDGCPECLGSPLVQAAHPTAPPTRREALELLALLCEDGRGGRP